jgi:hypothetical protein
MKTTRSEHVVYINFFECQNHTKKNQVMYTICSELVVFMYWSGISMNSLFILWVSWCKNKCVWKRFTCNSCTDRIHNGTKSFLTFPLKMSHTKTKSYTLAFKGWNLKKIFREITWMHKNSNVTSNYLWLFCGISLDLSFFMNGLVTFFGQRSIFLVLISFVRKGLINFLH